jgi:hypothetical protein
MCGRARPHLVSWWPGDGDAADFAGLHHGTPQLGASFTAGLVGRSFHFDGIDDHVEVPDGPILTPSAMTITAWVNPTTIGVTNEQVILSKYSSCSGCNGVSWVLYSLNTGKLEFVVYQTSDGITFRRLTTSAPVLEAGIWKHVAATFDSGTQAMKIFVNGVEAPSSVSGSTIGSIADTATPVRIGAYVGGAGHLIGAWNGRIDELQFHDRALSPCEVKSLYLPLGAGQCKVDGDEDEVLDFKDTCPGLPGASQTDSDQDGAGDACDCAPLDAGALSAPGDLHGPLVSNAGSGAVALDWCVDSLSIGSTTVYDVLRGSLADLPVGSGSSEACLADDQPETAFSDPTLPTVEPGFWYLVRGANSCGAGTYGDQSNGDERSSFACP